MTARSQAPASAAGRSGVVALRWLLAALATLTSCSPPVQSGGVETRKGAAQRAGAVCRWRHGDVAGVPCAEPTAAPPSRVTRITSQEQKLRGPLAIGRAGDYRLDNEEIAVVIDQLGRGSGFAESGGNLVDASDARLGVDELGQVFTYFGVFPRQAIYEKLESGVDAEGAAFVEVTGHELYEERLAVTTRYALRPRERAVLITTTLENRSPATIEGLDLGDAVQWGATEKIAPGKEPGFRGDSTSPYIAGVGTSVGYALMPVDDVLVVSKNGTAWSNMSFARGVALAPGEKKAYARVFVVARRGDSLAVATELFFLQGGAPGGLEIAFVDAAGAPLAPPAGATLLLDSGGAPAAKLRVPGDPLAIAAPRAPGPARTVGAEIPPGRYAVACEGGGRRALGTTAAVIEAGRVSRVELVLGGAGELRVTVREAVAGADLRPTPAKVQVLDAASGKPALAPILSRDGDVAIPLAPGSYRVIASRGPEVSIAEATVEVAEGGAAAADLTIARVVDTSGYVACDLHQHTALSADAGVAASDRMLGNAAEGVECAVASEHNNVVDFAPIVRALGLEQRLRSIVGDELTSDASREPFGHANVFPLTVDPADPRGGAPAVRDRTAREVFAAVRALPGEKVLQVNHPRAGRTGYFDQQRLDHRTGEGAAPGYDPGFDALEVWSGRYVKERARVLDDLWALLRTGHPVTPTANTDTHGMVGQEAGYPRTLIAVPDDDPARLDVGAVVRGLRVHRDVVITNGPFVTLRARAGDREARQGGVHCASRRPSVLLVSVEWPEWMDVTEAQLITGGVAGEPIPLGTSRRTPLGARRADLTLPLAFGGRAGGAGAKGLRVAADTFVVAVVRGNRPLEPLLRGEPAELLPFAMTAPLWIDADGDGRALGREGAAGCGKSP